MKSSLIAYVSIRHSRSANVLVARVDGAVVDYFICPPEWSHDAAMWTTILAYDPFQKA